MRGAGADLSASYTESGAGSYAYARVKLLTTSGVVGGSVEISPYLRVGGNMRVSGTFTAVGTKNRVVETEDYGDRLLYCYESASPMFGDIGEGITDKNGECYVGIDHIFSETVNPDIEYQVFLQKEGEGDLWVAEKERDYFVVKGTGKLKFSWEIKALQRDYEYERLEEDYGEGHGMAQIVDMEIEGLEQEWQNVIEEDETVQEDIFCGAVQEASQDEAEQEDMWYGITQELYGY